MKCPSCKNEISEDLNFCIVCGNRITHCSKCGKPILFKTSICISCGESVPPSAIVGLPNPEEDQEYQIQKEKERQEQIKREREMQREREKLEEAKRRERERQAKSSSISRYLSLAVVLVCVFIAGWLISSRLGGKTDDINQDHVAQNDTEAHQEQQVTEKEPDPVQTVENLPVMPEETKATEDAGYIRLSYADSQNMNYPSSPSDFVFVQSQNGEYTFCYPKDFFREGYYDPSDSSYHFIAADGFTGMTIMEWDPLVPGDPKGSADRFLSHYEYDFIHDSQGEDFYVFRSKGVADDGFSRSIVTGSLVTDEKHGRYLISMNNGKKTYVMQIDYRTSGTAGNGVEGTPMGYILDCTYRGLSISGSTYQLRSFKKYQDDDMGDKKK